MTSVATLMFAYSANLLKLRSERDNQPEEEPKKQMEDNTTKSSCEDAEDPAETEGKEFPSSDDMHMAVDETRVSNYIWNFHQVTL